MTQMSQMPVNQQGLQGLPLQMPIQLPFALGPQQPVFIADQSFQSNNPAAPYMPDAPSAPTEDDDPSSEQAVDGPDDEPPHHYSRIRRS